MKSLKSLGIAAVLLSTLFLASCQTSGQLVRTETSPDCPNCKLETRTSAIKGTTYTQWVGNGCKTELVDLGINEGGGPYKTVYSCDKDQ